MAKTSLPTLALTTTTDIPGESPLTDARDADFLAWWAEHYLDPRDPQRDRWAALERAQLHRAQGIADAVARYTPMAGATVLDVGCQTGALPIALARRGARVIGADVCPRLLSGAALRARSHGVTAAFVCAHAERLPFGDESFSAVTFIDVIEHVHDPRAAVREIARVLRPGGVLYLLGPNRLSPRLFASDPHYGLTGVSVLPPALGRFYVTRVRGFPQYDVGTLPVGGRVASWLREENFEIADSALTDARRWWDERAPRSLASLYPMATAWGMVRQSFAELFRFVAIRR